MGLRNPKGIFVEDLAEIRHMFGLHFQSIFAKYPLVLWQPENCVSKLSLLKFGLWSTKRDYLGPKIAEDEPWEALAKIKNETSLDMDGHVNFSRKRGK